MPVRFTLGAMLALAFLAWFVFRGAPDLRIETNLLQLLPRTERSAEELAKTRSRDRWLRVAFCPGCGFTRGSLGGDMVYCQRTSPPELSFRKTERSVAVRHAQALDVHVHLGNRYAKCLLQGILDAVHHAMGYF